MKKNRDAEWQAESLRLEKETTKAQVRVKVYEHKNQDWEMKCKIEEYKQGNITNHQR